MTAGEIEIAMAYQPFQILGATIPPMVGRSGPVRQLTSELAKRTPSHISLVGPKHCGKSVLLQHLAGSLTASEEQFSSVIVWDLAHQTPGSDEEFMAGFCKQLSEALKEVKPDYATMLDGAAYSDVKEILEALAVENCRILMIWDGFDKPLRSGRFSRNHWDQLRELASQPSLRLITATRRGLQELIRSEESVTSDFWNIFGVTVKLGPFDDQDIDDALASRGFELEKGARTELVAASGCVPVLILSLMNSIGSNFPRSLVTQKDIASVVGQTVADQWGLLASLWDDCDQPARELFYELLDGDIAVNETSTTTRLLLVERGLAATGSSRLRNNCRMMAEYVASQQPDRGTLRRQFGKPEAFAANMHSALELRLAQLESVDPRLKRLIQLCFEDLPDAPDLCLTHVRDVSVRLADLMLAAELGSDLAIPDEWISVWTREEYVGRSGEPLRTPDWFNSNRCPRENRDRIELLRLIINPRNAQPKAAKCSRLGIEQVQVLKRLGDYGEHSDKAEVSVEVALSALHLCVEAAATLCRDLVQNSAT